MRGKLAFLPGEAPRGRKTSNSESWGVSRRHSSSVTNATESICDDENHWQPEFSHQVEYHVLIIEGDEKTACSFKKHEVAL